MIAQVYQNLGSVVVLLLLLGCSAFFSGAETAFFSLTHRQIKQLGVSSSRLEKLAAGLLRRPGHLLNCLLLGNMTVNVLFYAISSVLVVRVGQGHGLGAATAMAFCTFIVLVLFGEIVPKSLIYLNARPLAIATAAPVYLAVRVFGPIALFFRFLFLEPVLRIFFGRIRLPKTMTLSEFGVLVDLSRRRGLLTADENRLLVEVVELGLLKVRHVMRPRVDMAVCSVADSPDDARKLMLAHRLTKVPVYVRNVDNVVGLVYLRQLLLKPGVPLDRLVQPVHFVPEQKTVESLLEFFRKTKTDTAVVVDEYGGIAGAVQLEDIAEELFGRMEMAAGIEPIKQLGPFQYRLAGDLAIHDWADVFGIDLEETRLSTIGGLVTTLLDKIPRKGDVAYMGNLKFTVDRVRKHRIETVILSLEPIPGDGQ
ncbi:MAG: HlyC/CorC family transporter [Sedimentisphaerales bacterium]|nr:HlyC/CorC family transporter [Sedimentisphaerales bacterium]